MHVQLLKYKENLGFQILPLIKVSPHQTVKYATNGRNAWTKNMVLDKKDSSLSLAEEKHAVFI